jgi:hypothetical protein
MTSGAHTREGWLGGGGFYGVLVDYMEFLALRWTTLEKFLQSVL